MDKKKEHSVEAAEKEFERFMDLNDREQDILKYNEDDREDFIQRKNRIIKQIQRGNIVVQDDGRLVFTPVKTKDVTEPITFRQLHGGDYMAMDRAKKNHDIQKLHKLIESNTGLHINKINKLVGSDYKTAMDIISIFLDE